MMLSALADELAGLEARGIGRRRRLLQSPQSSRVTVDGRAYVAFCSNDYLGLANDPRLVQAMQEGVARCGVGAGASHLLTGHGEAHEALEQALARFVGLPRAVLFSSGYMANIGVVTALAGRGDVVFADRLNHASLNDACLLSRARFTRYAHGDLDALEKRLATTPARRRLIVSDAVFSMDGDLAPLDGLLGLAERYDAWLYVDDAHGFGVVGRGGRGALAHAKLASPRLVYMATLGKAAGVFGAFVAGDAALAELLVQRARTYVYTTATPPALAIALLKSLELIETEEWRRERLQRLVATIQTEFVASRWRLLPSQTAIQPVVIGGNADALLASERLAQRGLLVPAIRPPTVPQGTARLRISLSAAHTAREVAELVGALNDIARP